MGMFDYVICEHRLPHREHESIASWQTKSFENSLDVYVIGKEGRIFRESTIYHPVESWNGFPTSQPADTVREDVNYHGVVRFYSLFPENYDWAVDFNPDKKQEWVEYEAKFTDGALVDIKMVAGVDWEKVWNASGGGSE